MVNRLDPFDALMAHRRETEALSEILGRLGWDMETVMPPGAAEQRAEEIAVLEGVVHARRTDPRIGEWLAAVVPADELQERQAELIRRDFERNARVPATLASALAGAAARGHAAWAAAREAEDFSLFAPQLQDIIELSRDRAAALADGGDPYDAVLEDHEPAMTADELENLFGALRPRLLALRDRIAGAGKTPPGFNRAFDDSGQLRLARQVAEVFGYDFSRGRIDRAIHPFTSGSWQDVRITTRTSPAHPEECLYSTLHEVGHAAYEQAIDRRYRFTPVGRGASNGIHESQSRLYENQIGRGRPFAGWLFEAMREEFGDIGIASAAEFWLVVNRCETGFIRTEADEVHYNLHVLMRFDMERDLIAGRLSVPDLPEAWNARFLADFGLVVDSLKNGVLQDVHWAKAAFGYFPGYTLGNVYAGCLFAALKRDVPDFDDALARGDVSPATGWLRANVQRHGSRYMPKELVERATGSAPTAAPLLDYLEAKFSEIYGP